MRAFVSGAGSGFGRAIARRLLRDGASVVATDLSVHDVRDLADDLGEARARFEPVGLDLRDPGTIENAVRAALAGGPIDVLVNNAGYAMFAAQAEGDVDAVSAQFDANVIGTARVTRALLPALRATSGTIVQISSIAGRMVFPESGFYAATKHALEALSEALYLENVAFGVKVVVIEPGAFDTGFAQRASRASRPRPQDSAYAGQHALWDQRKVAILSPPQDPEVVADAVAKALGSGIGFQRVPVGEDATRILGLRDALGPDGWVRYLASRVGGPSEDSPLGTPEAALAATDAELADDPRFAPVRAAWTRGMLDHWDDAVVARVDRALRR